MDVGRACRVVGEELVQTFDALVTISFLATIVVMPGATSELLATSSDALVTSSFARVPFSPRLCVEVLFYLHPVHLLLLPTNPH